MFRLKQSFHRFSAFTLMKREVDFSYIRLTELSCGF